jgi:hypothetical protein
MTTALRLPRQPNAEHNRGNAGQSVAWCAEQKINPATATEDDATTFRKPLVGHVCNRHDCRQAVRYPSLLRSRRVARVAPGQPCCWAASTEGQGRASVPTEQWRESNACYCII